MRCRHCDRPLSEDDLDMKRATTVYDWETGKFYYAHTTCEDRDERENGLDYHFDF